MKRIERYVVDGKDYDSLEEMPLEVRKKWEAAESLFSAMRDMTGSNCQPGERRTVFFHQTTTFDDDVPDHIIKEIKQRMRSRPNQMDAPSTSLKNDTKTVWTKRSALGFCVLVLPATLLGLLAIFGTIHPIVRYTSVWFIGLSFWVTAVLVCVWGFRDKLRTEFFPKNDATPFKLWVKILAMLLGLAVMGGYTIFGATPMVFHYFTAHPGGMVVTVAKKDAGYRRGACSPRLKIAEFTFFLKDHLCPSDRAFTEIQVGDHLRLEGLVSPYAISVDRFYRTTKD